MHYLKLNPVASSVRLYPRLAMVNGPHKAKRVSRTARVRKASTGVDQESNTAESQVRARLLHMIIENERVRRHEQRPNAS
jgi:hypothetical protein